MAHTSGQLVIAKVLPKDFVFSAQTCLQLLPKLTTDQLKFELEHLNSLRNIKYTRQSNPVLKTDEALIGAIRDILDKSNHGQYEDHLAKLNTTLSLMTSRLSDAEKDIALMVRPSATATPPTPLAPEITYNNEVFHFVEGTTHFEDFTVDGVLGELDFNIGGSGGRKLDFRGPSGYSYGRMRHQAKDFGDSTIVAAIFDRLSAIDQNVTRERYTILATHYSDGSASIPEHHDDEPEIVPGSLIYTISIGAERTIRLINKVGLIQERTIKLPHGSVHVMNADSQRVWAHAIDPEPAVNGARVSFTLRQLDPKFVPVKAEVPRIKPSDPVLPTIAMGSHHRVLLLTDSVLSSTPVHLLNRVPQHRVIKKVNYELANMFGYEPEFAYSAMVVLACGVNDLSRYGKRAHVLADLVTKRLSACLLKHHSTHFVFMSILDTNRDWLNREIWEFNRIMFQLSLRHTNLSFLDSQQVLYANFRSPDMVIEGRKEYGGNGIHLTLAAKKEISWELSRVLRFLAHSRLGLGPAAELRNWSWKLRPGLQAIFRQSQGGRSPGRIQ